jgi:Ca2+-binding EF-hand superfamily protein
MKTLLSAALVATTLATIGIAVAGPNGPHKGGVRGAHGFEHFDTNQDGKVTRDEFQAAMDQHWQTADVNQDGAITPEEGKRAREQKFEKFAAMRFAKLDANQDGQVTKDEASRMPAERYAQLDANKDGALSADEFKAGRPSHKFGKGGPCRGANESKSPNER